MAGVENEQIEQIQLLLMSDGWNKGMKPQIAERGQAAIRALCRPTSERQGEYKEVSDEFLRGQISAFEWTLRWFPKVVEVYLANQRTDELQGANNS